MPLVTVSWTCTLAPPASTSLIETRLLLPAEKTSAVSSLVDCAAGTLFTGASSIALTVIATVSTSVRLPASVAVTVSVSGPA